MSKHLTGTVHLVNFFCLTVDVILDDDMAHPCLIVSDDGKQVRYGKNRTKGVDGEEQNEKFDTYLGVLAKEGFSSGCFYFEVQVKGHTLWDLGVVRESINRIGDFDLHPRDGYWIVGLRYEKYLSYCPKELFSLNVKPQNVGVFVNYYEGLVFFYDVESLCQIYSYTRQCFNEKLYPFVCFGYKWTENSTPLIICDDY